MISVRRLSTSVCLGLILSVAPTPAASAQDAGCDIVKAGAKLTSAQRSRMIELRQRFFGSKVVDPRTGDLNPDYISLSWITTTAYVLALNGNLIMIDAFIGDDSGYIPTHDCELSGLRPDFLTVGHGHSDHAELAPTMLNRNRGTVFIGASEHCTDMETALAGLMVPTCVESQFRGAPPSTRIDLVPVIPGVEISTMQIIHGSLQQPDLDDPSTSQPNDPSAPKPVNYGPCRTNCPPPRPNFVKPTYVEDGNVCVLYQFRVREFALTYNNCTGHNQPGDPILSAMSALPQTDLNLGAIVGLNNQTNGYHDTRLITEALRARLFVPGHHDFLSPFSGSGFERGFRAEMNETPAASRPGILWTSDPKDYLRPERTTWLLNDPIWAKRTPIPVSD